jgi:hypothetical protein
VHRCSQFYFQPDGMPTCRGWVFGSRKLPPAQVKGSGLKGPGNRMPQIRLWGPVFLAARRLTLALVRKLHACGFCSDTWRSYPPNG